MRIGIDFDNTIVCYDAVFHKVAVEKRLIPATVPISKQQVRHSLRERGLEESWVELQGYVYGNRMLEAEPFPGVLAFFALCREQRIPVSIISHRTRRPFRGHPYDLHAAAKQWIDHNGFYENTGLKPDQVYFELTKEDKLERIRQNGCDVFIDDLPEFLSLPDFPPQTRRILFDPSRHHSGESAIEKISSWSQAEHVIINRERSSGVHKR